MSKTTEIPSNTELLKTNSLSYQEIIERLDLIYNLLIDDPEKFNAEELIKLEKLIEKSNFRDILHAKEVKNSEDNLTFLLEQADRVTQAQEDAKSLSEKNDELTSIKSSKYFSGEQLDLIAKNIKRLLDGGNKKTQEDNSLIFKNREPRTQIRITPDSEHRKEIIFSETKIIEDDENNYTLKYPDKEDDTSNYTNFLFSIKFRDNKVEFIFEKVFKESDPSKMKEEDFLFPEEIQIAMLKKLTTQKPEILEKIKSSRKINCTQSLITNQETLLRMAKYLELRADNPKDLESKKYLSSSPNQSNTQNFMNQLNHVFGIEISNSTPPKVICGYRDASTIKQTFITSRS